MKIFRVVVRGQFADIDGATDHHFLKSAFTADGTLTYDDQLVAFNFRYEVRHQEPVPDDEEIGAAAMARGVATLARMGVRAKHLRTTITDMATIWD